MIQIDGKEWNVNIIEVTESAVVLYSDHTGQTIAEGGRMLLDPIGTNYGHTIVFNRYSSDVDEYDELYMELTKPRASGFVVNFPHNQEYISYEAYVENIERELVRIEPNGKIIWGAVTVEFLPIETQVKAVKLY